MEEIAALYILLDKADVRKVIMTEIILHNMTVEHCGNGNASSVFVLAEYVVTRGENQDKNGDPEKIIWDTRKSQSELKFCKIIDVYWVMRIATRERRTIENVENFGLNVFLARHI